MNININKFIENNTHIDKDEKEIVKFGIDMMISTIMAFITAIIISAVLGMFNELTKSERKYLRNKVRIFLSSEVVIFVLLLIKANEYWSGIIAISMMIVAILVLAGFIENRIRG